ncbi:hypothetical protein [Chryseobacterium cheonjiense]|uniref:Uncharacterized protein n=1 Tax=Chryseobacterium cheonjiense TaxID=2728845 RepID=A0A7Y0A7U0_9FLAO|nr:hypothetical protein [Chryseobacterium cheonjiense]NML58281.1 hypothetical protein [Chryseobacterium cheonjiense]
MKKILITTLLTLSTVAFAKTEEPKTKMKKDVPDTQGKVLVAKKTIQGEEVENYYSLDFLFKHPCETWAWVKNPMVSMELVLQCDALHNPTINP